MIARIRAAALAVLLAGCAAAPDSRPTIVILVRHAEKAAVPGDDPPLSTEGRERAQALAAALADTRVEAIHVTQRRRTAETAEPLRHALGLTAIVTSNAGDSTAHARAVAAAVLARDRGRTVLVVGHSNTIPAIVRALGGTAPPGIPSDEYDNLWIVTIPAAGPAATVRVRFGAPSAIGAEPAKQM